MPPETPRREEGKPWGRAVGLGAACLITLWGVARNEDPNTLLLRAAWIGAAVGLTVAVALAVLRRLVKPL